MGFKEALASVGIVIKTKDDAAQPLKPVTDVSDNFVDTTPKQAPHPYDSELPETAKKKAVSWPAPSERSVGLYTTAPEVMASQAQPVIKVDEGIELTPAKPSGLVTISDGFNAQEAMRQQARQS